MNFRVLSPDPHRFDSDQDGVGCEADTALAADQSSTELARTGLGGPFFGLVVLGILLLVASGWLKRSAKRQAR